VAEEFALHQVVGDRRAVDGDEGSAGPRAQVVDGAGGQLLSSAALAPDQHRRGRARHPLDGPEHLAHDVAATHQIADPGALIELVGKADHLPRKGSVLQVVLDLDAQRVGLEGLGHVVRRAPLHGFDGCGDGTGRSEDDHGRCVDSLLQLREELETIASRHHQIENHQIRRCLGEGAQAGLDTVRSDDLAVLLEEHAQGLAHPRFVVHHQHARHAGNLSCAADSRSRTFPGAGVPPSDSGRWPPQAGAGRSRRMTVSSASVVSTVSVPPWDPITSSASTISIEV